MTYQLALEDLAIHILAFWALNVMRRSDDHGYRGFGINLLVVIQLSHEM